MKIRPSVYMMSQELLLMIRILDMSQLSMAPVINRGKFGIPSTFSLSRNLRVGLFGFPVELAHSSLLTTINSTIFLLMVPLEGLLSLGRPPMVEAMYCWFPFRSSSSSQLLSHFILLMATTSITFLEEDFSLWRDLFLSLWLVPTSRLLLSFPGVLDETPLFDKLFDEIF